MHLGMASFSIPYGHVLHSDTLTVFIRFSTRRTMHGWQSKGSQSRPLTLSSIARASRRSRVTSSIRRCMRRRPRERTAHVARLTSNPHFLIGLSTFCASLTTFTTSLVTFGATTPSSKCWWEQRREEAVLYITLVYFCMITTQSPIGRALRCGSERGAPRVPSAGRHRGVQCAQT